MKLFNIDDAARFFDRVLRCQGDVYFVEDDGRRSDLKRVAEYCIRSGMAAHMKGIDEIQLQVERESDVVFLMNYACQMAVRGRRNRLTA